MKGRPKESNSICNLPCQATINIYKSDETGRWYIEFMSLIDELENVCELGLWTEKYFTKKEAFSLMRYLCKKEDAE